jgi:hypothetical protein
VFLRVVMDGHSPHHLPSRTRSVVRIRAIRWRERGGLDAQSRDNLATYARRCGGLTPWRVHGLSLAPLDRKKKLLLEFS